jgi:hypothetical protein
MGFRLFLTNLLTFIYFTPNQMTYKPKKENKLFLKTHLVHNICSKFSKFATIIPSLELILKFLEKNVIVLLELLPFNINQIKNNKPRLISMAANN